MLRPAIGRIFADSGARHAILAAACLLLVAASRPDDGSGPDAMPEEAVAAVDLEITAASENYRIPGLSVAVAQDDGSLLVRRQGVASLEDNRPVSDSTRFRIGSISKLVTAAALLKLAQEGRLDLSAPIATLFPDDPQIAALPRAITVERLLNHTSGLADYTLAELQAKAARGVSTRADLEPVLARPQRSDPGAEWAYADAPFQILSYLVERTSGMAYGEYIDSELAPALGLGSLALCESDEGNRADGYIVAEGPIRPEAAYAIRGLLGAGGLCATAGDLARLPIALSRTGWLTPESLARMVGKTRLSDESMVDYGLAVRGALLGSHRGWGHTGGGLDGSWAAVSYFPEKGVSVAVVANGTGGEVDAATLQGRIAALVLGVDPPLRGMTDPAQARLLVGAYSHGGRITCLAFRDGQLKRFRPRASATEVPLYQQSPDRFARLDYPLDSLVFQIGNDRATAYRVYYDGLFAELWRRADDNACPPSGTID